MTACGSTVENSITEQSQTRLLEYPELERTRKDDRNQMKQVYIFINPTYNHKHMHKEEYNSPNSHVTCITTPNTSKCYKYLTVGTHFHLFSQQKLMQLQIHQSHQQPNLTKHTAMAVTTVTPPPLHRVVQLLSPTQPRPCSSPALWDTAAMEMWSHRSENVTTKCKQSIQLQQESWHCLR